MGTAGEFKVADEKKKILQNPHGLTVVDSVTHIDFCPRTLPASKNFTHQSCGSEGLYVRCLTACFSCQNMSSLPGVAF